MKKIGDLVNNTFSINPYNFLTYFKIVSKNCLFYKNTTRMVENVKKMKKIINKVKKIIIKIRSVVKKHNDGQDYQVNDGKHKLTSTYF